MTIVLDEVQNRSTDLDAGLRVEIDLVSDEECVCPELVPTPVPVAATGIRPGLILWALRLGGGALRVKTGATTETLSKAFTAGRNYFMAADRQGDFDGGVGGIGDLVEWLEELLNTNTAGGTYAVNFDGDFHLVVTCNLAFDLLWSDVLTTIDPYVFGWFGSDGTKSLPPTLVSPLLPEGIWRPRKPVATDSRDRSPNTGGVGAALSGEERVSDLVDEPKKWRDLSWARLQQDRALMEYSPATEPTGSWEAAWRYSVKLGRPLRYYPDELVRTSTSYGLYKIRSKDTDGLTRNRRPVNLWNLSPLLLVRAD